MTAKLLSINGKRKKVPNHPEEGEMSQQVCGQCNWPHFKLYLTEERKVVTECLGCGGLAWFGIIVADNPPDTG